MKKKLYFVMTENRDSGDYTVHNFGENYHEMFMWAIDKFGIPFTGAVIEFEIDFEETKVKHILDMKVNLVG